MTVNMIQSLYHTSEKERLQ